MKLKLTLLLLLITLLNASSFCQFDKIEFKHESSNWNFLRAKILPPNAYAARFKTDIRVQLVGNLTHEDSLYIKKLIADLKTIIKTTDINLVNAKGNLLLEINTPHTTGHHFHDIIRGVIQKSGYTFSLDSSIDQKLRNKHLSFYLFNALTSSRGSNHGHIRTPSSIFEEADASKSKITEVDIFIIQKLYSPDFYDQFKANFHMSRNEYYHYRYGDKIFFIGNTIGLALGFVLLLLLLKFRLISTEITSWWSYIKQGFLTIHCVLSFYLLSCIILVSTWFVCFSRIIVFELLLLFLLSGLYYFESLVSNKQISIKLFVQSVSTALIIYFLFISYPYILSQAVPNLFNNSWTWAIQLEQITILIAVVCIRLIFNFVNFKNIQEIRMRDIELSQLKLLKSKAELQALHSRINPHFLYNSLNSIATLAHIDPSKTEQMALSLSDFFRYAINNKDQDMIEVSKEVDIARTYLQIEKTRFGEDLDFTIKIDDSTEKTLIPRFLIQPLIENAVKHGVSVIQGKGIIKLEISKQEDHLDVRVFDNGPDFPDMPISGYGLQSLYEKLEILYGEAAKISWENQPNKNICIRLPFTPKSV